MCVTRWPYVFCGGFGLKEASRCRHGLNRTLQIFGLPWQDFFDHGRDRILLLREYRGTKRAHQQHQPKVAFHRNASRITQQA
jgi:hypothetical protein